MKNNKNINHVNYKTITELPNTKVTEMQIRRAHQRYQFAKKMFNGGTILEIGCGGGQGLDLLSKNAESVTGCDIDEDNIEIALDTYSSHPKVNIEKMDAEQLLFDDSSINAIVLFETIYYINKINSFFQEAFRVLKNEGTIIICTANKDWPGFNPSPFSVKYYSVPELHQIASTFGFEVKMYGSFPDNSDTLLSKLTSLFKKIAVKFQLIPKTMKGKVLLKKIFLGKMISYPKILTDDLFVYLPPIPISHNINDKVHTAIFAVCKKIKDK